LPGISAYRLVEGRTVSWTAMKMLTGDATKYLGIIFGVAFASLLIAQQMAIFFGIMMLTTSYVRDVQGIDLWVMDRDVLSIDDFKPMSDTALYRIRSVPGVKWAVPFYKGAARARLTSTTAEANRRRKEPQENLVYRDILGFQQPSSGATDPATVSQTVMILGLDDATLVGAPRRENMVLGKLEDLRKPDAVILDKFSCSLLWRQEASQLNKPEDYQRFIGRTFEMNDHRCFVVGICDVSHNFQTLPIAYTTYSRAKQFVPGERKLLTFVLVKAMEDSPASLARVSDNIAEHTGNLFKARTQQEFIWDTIWYYVTHTGIPINFIITVLLGFLVGTAIAGQTFYQFTLENIKQFGALKAMGTSNGTILGMILLQALVVGPIGYSIGVGVAALFGRLTRDDPSMAFFMPWQVLAITGVAVMLICLLTSLLSIRRVLTTEPAIVFRA